MQTYPRTERISRLLQRQLARLIQQEIADPRLPKFVSISAVDVSPDLAHAKVRISVLGDNEKIQASLETLNHAAGYLRRVLKQYVVLRRIPQLHFVHDVASEQICRISDLIDKGHRLD